MQANLLISFSFQLDNFNMKYLNFRWWKDLDFTTKLPYARDRIVELYFWIVGTYFEPKYTLARKIMTKTIYTASIIDDTFDAYGFFEELKLFAEAVQRFKIFCDLYKYNK